MSEKNLTVNEEKALSREETRASVRYLTPAVDIYETDAGLTLVADVPGLNKDDLQVGIDQGVLTIEGAVAGDKIGAALFSEFTVSGYYRQFRLPEGIDPDRTTAELNNGVLTLQLAKAEAAKPKRIEIKTLH